MATRIHAVAAIRWKQDGSGNNVPEIMDLVPFSANDSVTDLSGQINPQGLATNIYLVDVDLSQAVATALNNAITASGTFNAFVLAQESYDTATPAVRAGNFDATPTAGQLTTFGTELLNRFPGLNAQQLQQAGVNILRAGLTRRQIVALMAQRFGQL